MAYVWLILVGMCFGWFASVQLGSGPRRRFMDVISGAIGSLVAGGAMIVASEVAGSKVPPGMVAIVSIAIGGALIGVFAYRVSMSNRKRG